MKKYKQLKINNIIILYNIITIIKYILLNTNIIHIYYTNLINVINTIKNSITIKDFTIDFIFINIFIYILLKIFNKDWKQYQKEEQ